MNTCNFHCFRRQTACGAFGWSGAGELALCTGRIGNSWWCREDSTSVRLPPPLSLIDSLCIYVVKNHSTCRVSIMQMSFHDGAVGTPCLCVGGGPCLQQHGPYSIIRPGCRCEALSESKGPFSSRWFLAVNPVGSKPNTRQQHRTAHFFI